MKIAYFILGDEFGGGMSFLSLELMKHFKRRGDTLYLICAPSYELVENAKNLGVNLICCECFGGSRRSIGFRDILASWRLYQILRSIKPDILHAQAIKAGIMGMIIGKLANVRQRFFTTLGIPFSELGNLSSYILKIIYKIGSSCASKMIFISKHDLDFAVEYGLCAKNKARIIYCGISIKAEKKPRSEPYPFKIIFVGRLMESKDPYTLIKAIAILRDKDLALHIVGDGVERARVEGTISKLNLNNKVIMHGQINDKNKLSEMSTSDLLVLTSNREGFGIVVTEAMAMKLPVIATNIGGIPEQIIDGYNGFLVPPKNESALAEKILYLMNNKNEAKTMGENGYKIYREKFELSRTLSDYESVYLGDAN